MSDVVKCPNCNQSVTADSEFCIFCGTKLPVFETVPEEMHSEPETTIVRKCKNGHEFTDGKLTYCPICGLPFDDTKFTPPKEETWTCTCGNTNSADSNYCEKCGRSKVLKPSKRKPDEPKPSGGTIIPEGMYAPTPDDLKKKK